MKRTSGLVFLALAALSASKARAEDVQNKLTVGDVINITLAVASLDSHPGVDKNGAATVIQNNFNFSGQTLLTFARVAEIGGGVIKAYNEALSKKRKQVTDDLVAKDPSLKDAALQKAVDDLLTPEAVAMRATLSGVILPHVKIGDLCLDAGTQGCPRKNDISVGILTGLLPIVDQQ